MEDDWSPATLDCGRERHGWLLHSYTLLPCPWLYAGLCTASHPDWQSVCPSAQLRWSEDRSPRSQGAGGANARQGAQQEVLTVYRFPAGKGAHLTLPLSQGWRDEEEGEQWRPAPPLV